MTSTTRLVIALVATLGCKGKDEPAPPAKPAAPTAPAEPTGQAPKATEATPTATQTTIKLADLPSGWERTDEADGTVKLELVAAANQTKFPVDNAVFTFTLGVVTDPGAPRDAAAYGEWHAVQMKDKVLKTEKLGDATYFELPGRFEVVTSSGGKLLHCGGSLYRDKDYNQIPKIRDAAIAQAKQLCASMKL